MGPAYGVAGLSLNSTTTNNEKNKVVRTDGNGYTNFSWIKTATQDIGTGTISYIYVDAGDSYIKKIKLNQLFTQMKVTGNNVTQHGHTRLYSTSHTSTNYLSNAWNGTYWRLNSNDTANPGVSVAHADLATQAKYADLAEIYIVKNSSSIKEGTVLSVCPKTKWELEECLVECSSSVVGVLSSQPGFTLNGKDEKKENALPVALKGKNPVRIVGTIKKGDPIVSYLNGTARKAKHVSELCFSFGIALESNDIEEEKLVYCFIK